MGKRILSLVLALCLLLTLMPQTSLTALAVQSVQSTTDVAYAVEGGNIYFDKQTGTITDCDTSVTSANIPAEIDGVAVTGIGSQAFSYCYKLTNVIIPDGIAGINFAAFMHCSSLTGVTIPASVTSIGDFAFDCCSSLTSVTIPNSVTSIGDHAFQDCTGLTSVTIPNSVTSIGDNAFENCFSLTGIWVSAENPNYSSDKRGVLFNKDKTKLIQAPGALERDYAVPDSVTSIGDWAFTFCTGLTSVTIPASVTSIGDGAFESCTSLTSVTIPDSVTSIGNNAFSDCTSLTGIWVSAENPNYSSDKRGVLFNKDKTKLIQAPGALEGDYVIPASVTSIGYWAFENCTSLTSVTIPASVTSIGDWAFESCTSLTSVTIPNSVTSIGDYAFQDCTGLTSVTIPASVTGIGDWAFNFCTGLTSIFFLGDAPLLGYSAFKTLSDLTLYYLEGKSGWTSPTWNGYSTATWDGILDLSGECGDNLTWTLDRNGTLTISGSGDMYSYEEDCTPWYQYRNDINELIIKENVTGVSTYAFSKLPALRKITLPSSLTSVAEYSFHVLDALEKVVFAGTPEQWKVLREKNRLDVCLKRAAILYGGHDFDIWSFSNSDAYFDTDPSEGYYITQADYDRLVAPLSNTDRRAVSYSWYTYLDFLHGKNNFNIDGKGKNYIEWGGSCYGMAMWVLLNYSGRAEAAAIDSRCNSLQSMGKKNNDAIESAISFYHFQQFLTRYKDAEHSFMKDDQMKQLRKLAQLGIAANVSGNLFLICLSWENARKEPRGHALVGYGWEELDEPVTLNVNGTAYTYQYRVLVYDDAVPSQCFYSTYIYEWVDYDSNLYYNDDGVFCVPGWGIVSTNNQIKGSSNNGKLQLVTDDYALLNGVSYSSISGRTAKTGTGDAITLTTNVSTGYTLHCSDGTSAKISGLTVEGDADVITFAASNASLTDEAGNCETGAFLPDGSESYTLTTDSNQSGFLFHGENRSAAVAVDASGRIRFDREGAVSITAEQPTDYSISLVADDGYTSLPWYDIEISGSNTSAVSADIATDSIIISGDNLSNVEITGSNDETTVKLTVSTDENSMLITENQDGELAVLVDQDDDGTFETEIASTHTSFSDVKSEHWFYSYVRQAAALGLVNGYEDNTFRPFGSLTRAEAVTLLYRAAGSPAVTGKATFTDLDGQWYQDAICWAQQNKVVNGISATEFAPNTPITREAFLTMIWRYAGSPAAEGSLSTFVDTATVDTWAVTAFAWAVEKGIINGTTLPGKTGLHLAPLNNITRAEAAKILVVYTGL